MKIKTKAFGEIEVSEKQRITFKSGLYGFEDLHDFILLDTPDDSPFYWLQAENTIHIAFVLIDPRLVVNDYKVVLTSEDKKELDLTNEDDMLIFSIVTIYENPLDSTVNLLGPIVINKRNRLAKQIINQTEDYSVRHPLFKKEQKC